MERVPYDEFSMFHENAEEFGLPYDPAAPPSVRRDSVDLGDGRALSALVWGEPSSEPELVLLHGGGQNAHTWDTVALALDRPLVAIDLPGHGHSDGPRPSEDGVDQLTANAADVARVIDVLAPSAATIVGMSAGGLTSIALSTLRPDLVQRLALVDILPTTEPAMVKRITDFIAGPETFESFEEILARTVAFNPTRSVSSLRRGILHNAVQLDDGTWQWRHRRHRAGGPADGARRADPETAARRMQGLWDALVRLGERGVPLMLVRGMADGSVLSDAQEERLLELVPAARVERVDGAGHSVQGDRPVELAALLADFAPTA